MVISGPVIKKILWNLGLVFFVVYPIWYAVFGLLAYSNAGPRGVKDYSVGGILFFVLVTVMYVLAGWLVQQLLLLGVRPTWPANRRRVAAVVSTIVIPTLIVLLEPGFLRTPGNIGALIPGLLIYGLVLRLPREQRPSEDST